MSKNYYRWVQTPEYTGWVEYHTGDRYVLPPVAHVRIGSREPGRPLGWSIGCVAVIHDPAQPPILFDPVTLKQYNWNNHYEGDIHNHEKKVEPFNWLQFVDRADRNSTDTIAGQADVHVGMLQAIAGYWYDGPVRSIEVVNAAEELVDKVKATRKKVIDSDTIKHGPVLQEVVSGSH